MRRLGAACGFQRHPRGWWQQRDAKFSGLKVDLMVSLRMVEDRRISNGLIHRKRGVRNGIRVQNPKRYSWALIQLPEVNQFRFPMVDRGLRRCQDYQRFHPPRYQC